MFYFFESCIFSAQDDYFLLSGVILSKSNIDQEKMNLRSELVKYLHKAT